MNNAKFNFFPSWKENRDSWICFGIFIVCAFFGFSVHEPWYDEVQSWMIAKTASWYDIIFLLPHHEGHPPFWHLLLALPAKAGIAWQIVYPFIGMSGMAVSGFLIIFKSPFPRWIRFLAPFTYFLFVQYGIIVRPYSLMVLLMILLAMCFPSKDEHSGRFVLLLAALCACHVFGIAIAGGITLAWIFDIKAKQNWGPFLSHFYKDNRFYWMAGLLAWALLLMCAVKPDPHSIAYLTYQSSVIANIFYIWLGLPADAVLTNLYEEMSIREEFFNREFLLLVGGTGLILWGFLLAWLPRKKWKYLLLPYGLLSILMVLYCSRHHIGLFFVLAGFVCWISLRDPDFSKPVWPESIYKLGKMLLVCCFVIPLGWTATHMYFDAKSKGFSETAQFLKEKNLLDKQIFGKWQKRKLADGTVHENIYVLPEAMKLSMYLGKNVVANFHMGTTKAYCGGEFTDGNFEISLNKWRAAQKPQVLLGRVDLNEIWPEYENLLGDYVPVYESSSQDFWKFNFPIKIFLPVFAHKDILQDYHLSRVETHDMEEL